MDYSNFIRTYYRFSVSQLKNFRNYYGRIANINRKLDVPKEFLHTEESESMFLPQFSLNIDAPTKYFVDFMEYYVALMQDLGFVFANKDRINDLYNNVVSMGMIENDEEAIKYIEFIVNVGVSTLEKQKILER